MHDLLFNQLNHLKNYSIKNFPFYSVQPLYKSIYIYIYTVANSRTLGYLVCSYYLNTILLELDFLLQIRMNETGAGETFASTSLTAAKILDSPPPFPKLIEVYGRCCLKILNSIINVSFNNLLFI